MVDLAIKNLFARKLRTSLTVVAVVAGLVLVIIITTILKFTEQSMDAELSKYAGGGQIYVTSQQLTGLTGQEFPPINGSLEEAEAARLLDDLGDSVDRGRSSAVLFRQLAPPPFPNSPPQALAIGMDPAKVALYLGGDVVVEAGEVAFSGPDAKEVILGDLAASTFPDAGEVGQEIAFAGQTFRVVGRVKGETQYDRVAANVVLMPIRTAQEIFHQKGTISALLITAPRLRDVGPLATTIRTMDPQLSVVTQEEMAKALDDALAGERSFFNVINYTAYIVAAVIVLIVMVMAVSERTREIGTMRALGASRRVVLATVVVEAAALGLLGGVIAIPATFVLDAIINYGLRQAANPLDLIQVVVTTTVLAGLFALLPAWRATRISPVEAIRHE